MENRTYQRSYGDLDKLPNDLKDQFRITLEHLKRSHEALDPIFDRAKNSLRTREEGMVGEARHYIIPDGALLIPHKDVYHERATRYYSGSDLISELSESHRRNQDLVVHLGQPFYFDVFTVMPFIERREVGLEIMAYGARTIPSPRVSSFERVYFHPDEHALVCLASIDVAVPRIEEVNQKDFDSALFERPTII